MSTENPPLAAPILRPASGGWMAISAEGSRLKFAVVGESKEDALARFGRELAAWTALVDAAFVPEGV